MENVCSFPTKSVMEPIAGACEMFYEWVENPALSHSLISQRALQCEGLSALTHMWELPGLSSLRWEKGDGVHTMWFIEDKYGWGSCQFYSLVRAQRKCFLHIQEVRLGGEMRKVLAAEQGGKSPTARWAVEPRLINPAGSGLSLCDQVRYWPALLLRVWLLQERLGQGSPLPYPERAILMRIWAFFPIRGPRDWDMASPQNLNIQRHLERGRVIYI